MLMLSKLRKAFNGNVAVDDLTLTIERGEVFGLLGPNGAGKTTTVNMAVGLLKPDGGTVELDGCGAPVEPRVRARIGVATQALALYEEMSGEENVRFFGRLQGLNGSTLAERTAAAIDFVGLAPRKRDRVSTYSGGMKRRLNLAAAVVHQPDLLLLDEPTVGVDPQSRNAIFENIEAMRDRGCTIVYTTHYMEEAQRLCSRVGIMDYGKLLALGTVSELIQKHGGQSRIVAQRAAGEMQITSDDPLDELRKLQDAGDLIGFHTERPTLETVFLNLTGRTLRDS
ncbi:MAG: ABC transporter ATP-binding protein [Phycisphaerae bacterium]